MGGFGLKSKQHSLDLRTFNSGFVTLGLQLLLSQVKVGLLLITLEIVMSLMMMVFWTLAG